MHEMTGQLSTKTNSVIAITRDLNQRSFLKPIEIMALTAVAAGRCGEHHSE